MAIPLNHGLLDITLDELGLYYGTDKSSSRHNYCQIYEKYFAAIRGKPVDLLEIGVQFGCSIRMWGDYFHNGKIYGVDIVNDFISDNPRIELFHGNASDPAFMGSLLPGLLFDIVIDDGSHLASDQSVTFDILWPRLKLGGLFIVEDVFTHFDPHFDSSVSGRAWLEGIYGALNRRGQQYHGRPHKVNYTPSLLENEIEFVHLYYGLIVIGKKP